MSVKIMSKGGSIAESGPTETGNTIANMSLLILKQELKDNV